MRNLSLSLCALTLSLAPFFFAPACHSRDDGSAPRDTTPGPAERAGQEVDEAARETKEGAKGAAHDVKEGTKDAAHDVKEGAKEAARETRDAARGAASAVGSATERAGQKMQGK